MQTALLCDLLGLFVFIQDTAENRALMRAQMALDEVVYELTLQGAIDETGQVEAAKAYLLRPALEHRDACLARADWNLKDWKNCWAKADQETGVSK